MRNERHGRSHPICPHDTFGNDTIQEGRGWVLTFFWLACSFFFFIFACLSNTKMAFAHAVKITLRLLWTIRNSALPRFGTMPLTKTL